MELQLADGRFNGQQVVSKAALEGTHKAQMCKVAVAPVPPAPCKQGYYGLRWNVNKDDEGELRLSHSGAFDPGTGTAIYLLPGRQVGIVVLTNGTPIDLPEAIGLSFLDFFRYGYAKRDYPALLRPVFEDMFKETQDSSPDYSKLPSPPPPVPDRALSAYAGTYASQYYGNLQVDVHGNRLILRLPPRDAYYELTHWDADTFTYYFANENTRVARRGVKFLNGAKQVLIENLAIVHDGVFTRVN